MALTVLVAYDIADDNRRARVAAAIQVWGDRIQYSVFVCTLGKDDLDGLTDHMAGIIDPGEDSVYVVRQCVACWESVQTFGQAHPPEQNLFWGVW